MSLKCFQLKLYTDVSYEMVSHFKTHWINFLTFSTSFMERNVETKKKEVFRTTSVKNTEATNNNARKMQHLFVGSKCLQQNQGGAHPRKCDRSEIVMEVLPHDQFVVRIDGLRRLTRRNRFLRFYNPVSTNTEAKVFNGW